MTMLELQVRTQNAATDLVRRTRDEDGQTSVEYLGIVVVVVAMIGMLVSLAPGIGTQISNQIKSAIGSIGGK